MRPSITNSLFLAFLPDDETVQRISDLASALRKQHGLTARLRPLTHLHVTLHWLGDFPEVPEALVSSVGQACKTVTDRSAPFEIHLDRVLSFRGRPGNNPLVLGGDETSNAAIFQFQKNLVAELAKDVPPTKGRQLKFKPHLTLMYDKKSLEDTPVPLVSWKAEELVLVCSKVGATRHHHLGSWKLCGSETVTHFPKEDLFD